MIFFGVLLVPLVICEKRGGLFLLLSVSLVATSSTDYSANSFLDHPNPTLYAEIGGKVTATWRFQIEPRVVKSGTQIEDIIFGEWGPPGYVKYKILYLDSNYTVQPRPGYENKVRYEVNISQPINCSAEVTILELTQRDFKTYGIDILVGLDRSPLINTFELRAPPRIIEFFSSGRIVAQGNKTAFECKAKGIPEPFVTIKKANTTLCNATSHCRWEIEIINIEDEGEYECTAKQDEMFDKRSESLTVQPRKDDGKSASESSSALMIAVFVPVAVVAVLIVLAISLYKGTWKKSCGPHEDKGRPSVVQV